MELKVVRIWLRSKGATVWALRFSATGALVMNHSGPETHPQTFDTLLELAQWITTNPHVDVVELPASVREL